MSLDVSGSLIGRLWERNPDLVQQFLENRFCKLQAEGEESETMGSYRWFSVQDYFYLVDYVRYKALRLAKCPAVYPPTRETLGMLETGARSVLRQIDFAKEFRNATLKKELQISDDVIDDTAWSEAVEKYTQWLEDDMEAWYGMYVKSIPCLYGWYMLANKLDQSPTTKKDTVFYRTWVKENLKSGPVEGLLKTLQDSTLHDYPVIDDELNDLFRHGMKLEIQLFNSAIGKDLDGQAKRKAEDDLEEPPAKEPRQEQSEVHLVSSPSPLSASGRNQRSAQETGPTQGDSSAQAQGTAQAQSMDPEQEST